MVRCLTAAVVAFAQPLPAQDMDEFMKWAAAEDVHYDVVAEYTGLAKVLVAPDDSRAVAGYEAAVTDRYEVSFDWNPTQMAMIGEPRFKNFPSTTTNDLPGGSMFGMACPSPKIEGSYEHMDVVAAKAGMPGSNSIEVTGNRTHPPGQVAFAGEGPCNNWQPMPGRIESVTDGVFVPPGSYFAMSGMADSNTRVDSANHVITVINQSSGWKYTYTLRIVN